MGEFSLVNSALGDGVAAAMSALNSLPDDSHTLIEATSRRYSCDPQTEVTQE